MNTKHCPHCNTTKPLSEFHKKKAHKDGYATFCKPCIKIKIAPSKAKYQRVHAKELRERSNKFAAENRELVRARKKARYHADVARSRAYNRERWRVAVERDGASIRKKRRSYYLDHRDASIRATRNWMRNNPERYRESTRLYHLAHPERNRYNQHRRRAIKYKTPLSGRRLIENWEIKWKSKRRVVCFWCRESFDPDTCHADHITALTKGGAHEIGNLCISCSKCNQSKNNKQLSQWNEKIKEPVLL